MLKNLFLRKREAMKQYDDIMVINGGLYCKLLERRALNRVCYEEIAYYNLEYPYRYKIEVPGYDLNEYGKFSGTYTVWKKRYGEKSADMLMHMYLTAYASLLLLQCKDKKAVEVEKNIDSLIKEEP